MTKKHEDDYKQDHSPGASPSESAAKAQLPVDPEPTLEAPPPDVKRDWDVTLRGYGSSAGGVQNLFQKFLSALAAAGHTFYHARAMQGQHEENFLDPAVVEKYKDDKPTADKPADKSGPGLN